MFQKIKQFAAARKITSGLILIVVIAGSYYSYKKISGNSAANRYVLAAVEKGTIVRSISGSGQVSVSNQLNIKPKVSGDVIYVGVKNGQFVRAGTLIAMLNPKDAQRAVRDAEINLENSQISLAKLKLNQESGTPQLQNAITNAQDNLSQSYQNGFNEVANSFLDLPDILSGIRGILYDSKVGASGQTNTGAYQNLMDQNGIFDLVVMINKVAADYSDSTKKYDQNLDDYKNTTRYSGPDQIISLINETLETAKTMAQTVKDEQNILDAVVASLKQFSSLRPIPQAITQYQADIAGYISKLNSHINNLSNVQNSITTNQQSLASAQRALASAQQDNPLDIASQENTVKQREAALQDTQDNLADYYIRAPFAGTIAELNVKRGDTVSGSTAVATLLTKQDIAEISLNEVDIAKIKGGQKATLTFDAVEGLTLTGEVSEIDALGTVSQGVVTYGVKINFDTQDDRIKPAMSVSAAIITDTKQNVLMIPNSAVKSVGGASYVEMPADASAANRLLANSANSAGILLNLAPKKQAVEIGLSNDSMVEISNGLKEGDLVIVRTISPASATQTKSTQGNSLFQIPGTRGGGGGNFRSGGAGALGR